MTSKFDAVFKPGNVAVITGGASGIGFAAAQRYAEMGLKLCLADLDEKRLENTAVKLAELCTNGLEDILTVKTDVTQADQVQALHDTVYDRFGQLDVLMNNAGIIAMSTSWGNLDAWQKVLDVNVQGVINGVHIFTPSLLAQNTPAMIINTGSKQGITCPPGSPAYNVSKAAVKAITETLQHDLRNQPGNHVSAHLLVPGFVYSEMVSKFLPEKPGFAWTPEQTIDYFLQRLKQEDFYIVCPDGEVTEEMDRKRILWGAQDIAENRPPLSRWHGGYDDLFAEHMES
ncbi:SDR family NAD(P)-dependent oxidoreductase [Maricurvus nonylphenolicus]|uniref:SDR family NAD(P)-dependent oxidoreductase n=1 Tax=Maricurvus nonylphenolicus TaxID=1008307 RepID=UPI0036F267EC